MSGDAIDGLCTLCLQSSLTLTMEKEISQDQIGILLLKIFKRLVGSLFLGVRYNRVC